MIKRFYLLLFLMTVACDSEDAGNCFQTAGNIIQQEFAIAQFDKILVNDFIELTIKQGETQKVIVQTGENLINDIQLLISEGRLTITNNNSCNFVRDFGITKVIITSPNIVEIRSNTRFEIRSEGVLNYPDISLLSETFDASETIAVGNFRLRIENQSVSVVFNNLSNLFIEGSTRRFRVNFSAGNSRLEGQYFLASEITVFQRSSNDMILHPLQAIRGEILSTGNIILVNRPELIQIQTPYRGRLIFN